MASLYVTGTLACHYMFYPTPLYKGDARHYFPKNDLSEKTTQNEIGNSYAGAIKYRDVILNGEDTYPSKYNKHYSQFCTYRPCEDNELPTGEIKGVF